MASIKILKRRDTAANWASANPILDSGEEGFETDTGKSKVGDGATAWNSLSYFNIPEGETGTSIAYNVPSSGNAGVNELVLGSDTRLTNSRTPTGAAGGVLSGSYPNPGFAEDMATQAELDAEALARSSADDDLQTQVDGKAATSHSHTIANVTGLQTALDGKADDSEITALTSAVAGKEDAGTAASAVASHEADTTSVHGIADTSALLDSGDIGVSVQAHSAVLDATTASFTTADETKLDGIEAGATADQSAAEILTAVKTVDGAGSGLDADLLDGNEATAFATAAQGSLADSAVQPGDDVTGLSSGAATDGYVLTADGLGGLAFEATGSGAVDSVNGQTGVVVLDATDVGADASGTAASAVASHEADTTSVHGIADTSALLDTADIGVSVQAHSAVLDATTASFTTADETKLDGIEAGATADQSAAEILTAIKTVDGASSGLDADLLDGNEASAFATAAQGSTADSAVQPGDDAADLGSGAATDGYVLTADGLGGAAWEAVAGGGAVDSVNGQTGVVVLDPDDLDDSATTNKFTTAADISKLAGIEASADVTDETNVAAAGAAMVYVQTDGATPSYQLAGGRIFVGSTDPALDGFTLADGDIWEVV